MKKITHFLIIIILAALFIICVGSTYIVSGIGGTEPGLKKEIGLPLAADIAAPPVPSEQSAGKAAPEEFNFPAEGIPVLMYHSISTVPGNSLCVPEEKFADQMAWLKTQNYHALTLDEFHLAISGRAAVPPKPVLITFDDGYSDNYGTAWPILRENGLKATFFIITSSVKPGRIDWDQLKELLSQGNSIESHTVYHRNLPALSLPEQEKELRQSKQMLEQRLGINVIAICYPAGKYSESTLKMLPELGYKLGFTTLPGKAKQSDSRYRVRRMRISGEMSGKRFRHLFP